MDITDHDDLQLRRLGPTLWAGWRNGEPLGTIERGRRYRVLDVDGEERGSYEAFDVAVEALGRPGGPVRPSRSSRAMEVGAFAVTSAFGIGAVITIGAAIAAGLL